MLSVVCMCCVFCGCSFSTGVENLLSPPKLTDSQEQIYSALTRQVGSKIKLRYPKTGQYLSAFVVANIDGEPSDEAIVFYERVGLSGAESALRINVLDMRNGVWESVYDLAGIGTDIERVMLSDMGNDEYKVIIGFSLISDGDKNVILYDYTDEKLIPSATYNYSLMELRDMNGDGISELFTVAAKSGGRLPEARLIALDNSWVSDYTLNANVNDFAQIVYGCVTNDVYAFFIDEIIASGTIQTELLSFDGEKLISMGGMTSSGTDSILASVRPQPYLCMDIDNDGVIEIPLRGVFPGYEKFEIESEQIPMIRWCSFENSNLSEKYSSYYSTLNSYIFVLPKRWNGNVTVKILGDEVVFYAFNSPELSIESELTELMRITVCTEQNIDTKNDEGYLTVKSSGSVYYCIKASKEASPLMITPEEALLCFSFL